MVLTRRAIFEKNKFRFKSQKKEVENVIQKNELENDSSILRQSISFMFISSTILGLSIFGSSWFGISIFGSAYLGGGTVFGTAYFANSVFGNAYFGSSLFGTSYLPWLNPIQAQTAAIMTLLVIFLFILPYSCLQLRKLISK